MPFPHRLVQHPAGDIRIPVIDRAKDYHQRRHAHHHMEMRHHEHGIRKRHVHHHIAQKQAGQPAIHKGDDKGERKQHRDRQMDVSPPQGQHPVVDFDRRRHRDDQGGGGKEKAEIRVHTADIHMMRPDDETQPANADNGPDHHPVAKNGLARMGRQQV